MFDNIRCEYALPLPIDQGELAGADWSKISFQTKDLGEGMLCYHLRPDGTLWFVGCNFDSLRSAVELASQPTRQPPSPPQPSHHCGEVFFYKTEFCKKHDYSVGWQASFADGQIKEIRLNRWELRDNTKRLRADEEWRAEAVCTERFLKTWVGKHVYPFYAWLVGLVFCAVVASSAGKLAQWLQRIQSGAWRWENRLKPHGDPIGARRWRRREEKFWQEHEADEIEKQANDSA